MALNTLFNFNMSAVSRSCEKAATELNITQANRKTLFIL